MAVSQVEHFVMVQSCFHFDVNLFHRLSASIELVDKKVIFMTHSEGMLFQQSLHKG